MMLNIIEQQINLKDIVSENSSNEKKTCAEELTKNMPYKKETRRGYHTPFSKLSFYGINT